MRRQNDHNDPNVLADLSGFDNLYFHYYVLGKPYYFYSTYVYWSFPVH